MCLGPLSGLAAVTQRSTGLSAALLGSSVEGQWAASHAQGMDSGNPHCLRVDVLQRCQGSELLAAVAINAFFNYD